MSTSGKPPKKHIPSHRIATRVVVMAVTPHLLHAYWRISKQDFEDIRRALHDFRGVPVLRFYDITRILFNGTNAHHTFDVEVELRAQRWNIPLWSADKSYVADLGYKAPGGRFHQVARSNIVGVPRSHPSPQLAEHYFHLERGPVKEPAPVSVPVPPVPSEEPSRPEAADWETVTEPRPRPETPPPPAPQERPAGGEMSDTRDLVRSTEEQFSPGLSSAVPGRGTPS